MKKIILIGFILTFYVSVSKSQEVLSEDQKSVQNTVIEMFEALSNRDSVSLKAKCTADILLFEYGLVWNLDTLITKAIRLNQFEDFKRINTIGFIDTKIDHNVAWTTYYNQADITQNGNLKRIKWIETVILVRDEKSWKIKLLHSTHLKNS